MDVAGQPAGDFLLVRQPSPWGYSKASWEVNLGCNYNCKHCYLGLKVSSGMPLADKLYCLDLMAEAGVLWLQITGGEPTIDKDFMRAYRHAFELGMMLTLSTNGSLLWRENLLRLLQECPPYRVTVSMYGATKASYDELTQREGAWDLFVQGMSAARWARLPLRMSELALIEMPDLDRRTAAKALGVGRNAAKQAKAAQKLDDAPLRRAAAAGMDLEQTAQLAEVEDVRGAENRLMRALQRDADEGSGGRGHWDQEMALLCADRRNAPARPW
ncbi:radical SAM protein [Streptomyces sp. NPDC004393]